MRLRAPAAKERARPQPSGPHGLHGDREKGTGEQIPPGFETKIGGPAWLDRINLRRRGADASRALQTFVPESAVVRHRETVIACGSEKWARSRAPAPQENPAITRRGLGRADSPESFDDADKIGKALSHSSALPLLPLGPGGVHVSESTGPHQITASGLARSGGRHLGCHGDIRRRSRRVESFLWTSFRCFARGSSPLGCDRDPSYEPFDSDGL